MFHVENGVLIRGRLCGKPFASPRGRTNVKLCPPVLLSNDFKLYHGRLRALSVTFVHIYLCVCRCVTRMYAVDILIGLY